MARSRATCGSPSARVDAAGVGRPDRLWPPAHLRGRARQRRAHVTIHRSLRPRAGHARPARGAAASGRPRANVTAPGARRRSACSPSCRGQSGARCAATHGEATAWSRGEPTAPAAGHWGHLPHVTYLTGLANLLVHFDGLRPSIVPDYRLFCREQCIPRLSMSTGCSYRCAFCTVPTNVLTTPDALLPSMAAALAPLDFQLVFLDDKSFGDAQIGAEPHRSGNSSLRSTRASRDSSPRRRRRWRRARAFFVSVSKSA
jgi:hypothetical protein